MERGGERERERILLLGYFCHAGLVLLRGSQKLKIKEDRFLRSPDGEASRDTNQETLSPRPIGTGFFCKKADESCDWASSYSKNNPLKY
jgi:hypothetical protein